MTDSTFTRQSCGYALLAIGLVTLAGCGGSGTGRYHVSGKATYAGKPIPFGRIYFDPDLAKKNDGLQGTADIKDGLYDTARSGQGTTGGAVIVRIEGFDGVSTDPDRPSGKPLFPNYQTAVELPRQNTTRDFDVPAAAARPGGAPPVPAGP